MADTHIGLAALLEQPAGPVLIGGKPMDEFEAARPVQAISFVTFVESARVVAPELERQIERLEAAGVPALLFREWMDDLRTVVADMTLLL